MVDGLCISNEQNLVSVPSSSVFCQGFISMKSTKSKMKSKVSSNRVVTQIGSLVKQSSIAPEGM